MLHLVIRHRAQLESQPDQHLVTLHRLKVVVLEKQMSQDGELIPPRLTPAHNLPPLLQTMHDQEMPHPLPHRHYISHPTLNCRT